jgi:hypothetical protein
MVAYGNGNWVDATFDFHADEPPSVLPTLAEVTACEVCVCVCVCERAKLRWKHQRSCVKATAETATAQLPAPLVLRC